MIKKYFRKDLAKKSENKIFVERKKTTLALNESYISVISLLSDFEKEKILNARIEKYPTSDFVFSFLTSLKDYCKVNSEQQILIANGIDELLYMLFIAINEKNAKIVVNVESVGLSFIELPLIENVKLDNEYSIDVKRLVKIGKRKDVKAIIFTNPNNPTGTLFPLSDMIYVTQKLKDKLIIIDEAYIEFCLEKTMIPLLNEFENLIVLRTFSKGFLSPGLRLGYLVSNSYVTSQLKKVFPVFPVSQFSIEIGKLLLEKKDEISKVREKIIENRQYIYEKLKEYKEKGYISKVYKSNTNFLLFSFANEERMKNCYDFLLKNEVSIRNVSSKYLKNSLRVTTTNGEETGLFLSIISKFFEEKK
jgi:histidinol-phosphate aminotransferase